LETKEGQYPIWSGQALIHSGFSLEYKYIIVRNGEVIWETGPVNRTLKTTFETMIVDDGMFNGLRIDVQTAPIKQVRAVPRRPQGRVCSKVLARALLGRLCWS
jgi:hypothetical protein